MYTRQIPRAGRPANAFAWYMCVYIHIYAYKCIYIYI